MCFPDELSRNERRRGYDWADKPEFLPIMGQSTRNHGNFILNVTDALFSVDSFNVHEIGPAGGEIQWVFCVSEYI